jgi:hypothetical protein
MFVKSSKKHEKVRKSSCTFTFTSSKTKSLVQTRDVPRNKLPNDRFNVFSPIFLIYSTIPKALSSKIEGFGVVLGVGYGENLCPRGSS